MLRLVHASSLSATITIVFTTVLTIWAEVSPSLKETLKQISGHHWVTKSYLVVGVYLLSFAVVYWLNRGINLSIIRRNLYILIFLTLTGFIAILSYFIWHYTQ